ncbi:hypothetical protein Q9189_002559 [Teloschistes chrysophthalmus]
MPTPSLLPFPILLTISTIVALILPSPLNPNNIPPLLLLPLSIHDPTNATAFFSPNLTLPSPNNPTTNSLTASSRHPIPPIPTSLIHCLHPTEPPLRRISDDGTCNPILTEILARPHAADGRVYTAPVTRLSGPPCSIELRKSEGRMSLRISQQEIAMTAVAVMRYCSGQGDEGGRRGSEGRDWGGSGWGGLQGDGGVRINWYVLVYGERV